MFYGEGGLVPNVKHVFVKTLGAFEAECRVSVAIEFRRDQISRRYDFAIGSDKLKFYQILKINPSEIKSLRLMPQHLLRCTLYLYSLLYS